MTVLELMRELTKQDADAVVYFANYDDVGVACYEVGTVALKRDNPNSIELLVADDAVILDLIKRQEN